MALHTVSGDNMPEKCIGLTREDAVAFQIDIMKSLTPFKNRVFSVYGPVIAAFSSGLTCISIANIALHVSGIGNRIRLHMSLPFIIAPAFVLKALHQRYIRDDIIIQKWACPACYHLKSGLFQVILGAIYPTFFGGYYAFASARKHRVPGIPPLNYRKEILECVRTRVKPVSNKLKIYAAVNFLIGVFLVEMEARETNNFNLYFEKLATEYNRRLKESIEV